MADNKTKKNIFAGLIVTFGIFFTIAFTLLLVGGIIYTVDVDDERLYKESTCRVLAMKQERYSCNSSSLSTTCKVTMWTVQHSGPTFINATIERRDRMWMSNSAVEKVLSYKVSKSADRDRALISFSP